jgi:hypothetical protein
MKLETKHYKPSDKPPIFLSLKENRSQRAVFFFTEKLTIILPSPCFIENHAHKTVNGGKSGKNFENAGRRRIIHNHETPAPVR